MLNPNSPLIISFALISPIIDASKSTAHWLESDGVSQLESFGRKKNFSLRTASRRCARFILSLTFEIGNINVNLNETITLENVILGDLSKRS